MAYLDKGSPIPLYYQLRAILQERIQGGTWQPEDRLPTEGEIASQYEVSKVTVRQALKELADAGFVRREQGRGTFVTQPRVEQGPRKLTSFSGEMKLRGMRASSRVLKQAIVAADAELRERLKLEVGQAAFCLKRLRLADGEPMGIQTAYLPYHLVRGIEAEDFSAASLYETLASKHGLKPARAQETHYAVALDEADARILRTETGAPALAAERLALLADGRPLEFTTSLMRGDRYQIVLNLTEI